MILKAYSVHDSAAAAYLPPFFEHRDQMAMRTFGHAVAQEGHQFCEYPQDYKLFCVGECDDAKGIFKPQPPHFLCSALEYIRDTDSDSTTDDLNGVLGPISQAD